VTYLTGHFPQKSPIISSSFANNDLQLKASQHWTCSSGGGIVRPCHVAPWMIKDIPCRWDKYSQSHLGCHFRKLKAQSSNVSFTTFQWKETFELWALSFETAFENVTPSGIGCTHNHTLRSCEDISSTGWRKCIGCLIYIGHFPHQSPMISGSCAEWDLHLKVFKSYTLRDRL